MFGIHSFCRGNLRDSRDGVPARSGSTTAAGFRLKPRLVAHLDGGSSKVRQLFDVLALLADDGPDGKRGDEQVDRLRLWAALLHTRGHVSSRVTEDR